MTTKVEVTDLRIQRVLPYIQNVQGETLDSLLLTIDNLLKFASPDAMAPGLINWSNKDLFLEKWILTSGSATIAYNQYGPSKIGKGCFEITGDGRFVYDRFLAVSEVRGVTGRVFLQATQPNAIATVGVECYDADQNLLGTNGGFIFNNLNVPTTGYQFAKSSAFGEATAGARFLKPGTRFVRFFIDVVNNSGLVQLDESELTTFELDERYLQIFGSVIDWNSSEYFYSEISANTTYSFLNDIDGRVKNIIIKNIGLGDIEVAFPSAKWQGGTPLTIIRPGRTSIFTFIKAGDILYASVIEEME